MAALLHPPPPEQNYLEKLDVFKIKGRDKQGRRILRITGKFFPARVVSLDVLKKHLEEKIFPRLKNKRFTILYFHTGVQRSQNFPGIAALRSIYDAIPAAVKANLEAVYFVHPDLQARLFLATLGRIFFTSEVYGKVRYVSRIDLLWEHVRRNEIEVPEFIYDHDEDLEYRPMMDYGLESDHPRVYGAPSVESHVYSMSFSPSIPSPRASNAASTSPISSPISSFCSHAIPPFRIRTFETNAHRLGFHFPD